MSLDLPIGVPTRFRPIELVGSGSSARVWRARDTRAGRDVAVKVVTAAALGSTELLDARLEAEARALARLAGIDGVVAVLEVGRVDHATGWIVSEYAAGGSLAQRGRGGRSELRVCADLARLAHALAHCHEREVVHGDITPANVLLDAVDRAGLVDFGLATLGPLPPRSPGLTPRFAAPERLAGADPSAAGDVYALGATLRWVLDGGPSGSAVGHLLASMCDDQPGRRPDAAELAARSADLERSLRG